MGSTYKIVWTPRARQGFQSIISYLQEEFSEKEVRTFVRESDQFFRQLSQFPDLLPQSRSKQRLHRGVMNPLTIVVYRVKPRKKEIQLINVRGTRQKPLAL